jgi:hypothetical protein
LRTSALKTEIVEILGQKIILGQKSFFLPQNDFCFWYGVATQDEVATPKGLG